MFCFIRAPPTTRAIMPPPTTASNGKREGLETRVVLHEVPSGRTTRQILALSAENYASDAPR